MKSFKQHLTEAGIRRKMRVAAAAEKQTDALLAQNKTTPVPEAELRAARRTENFANSDVRAEQNRRAERVVNRASAEALARTQPVYNNIMGTKDAFEMAKTRERAASKAVDYVADMEDAKKAAWVQDSTYYGKKLREDKSVPDSEDIETELVNKLENINAEDLREYPGKKGEGIHKKLHNTISGIVSKMRSMGHK
jgi:hypothetical protein